ncbi:MAG: hypothetical protein RLZZ68_1711 [Bacteroidota bacterium]|jgi:hypothetical protein
MMNLKGFNLKRFNASAAKGAIRKRFPWTRGKPSHGASKVLGPSGTVSKG